MRSDLTLFPEKTAYFTRLWSEIFFVNINDLGKNFPRKVHLNENIGKK